MSGFNKENIELNLKNKNQNELRFDLEDSEKIYVWTMNKKRMAMFRLSAYLKEKIIPNLLQTAVNSTIIRFPSFTAKIEKNFFDYYLIRNKPYIQIKEDKNATLRPLEILNYKSQCFRILYWNNRISIEIFHAITDGTGALEFLKVLVVEYLKLKGYNCTIDENVMNINVLPNNEEFENAFKKVPFNDGKYKLNNKKSIQLNGKMLKKYSSYNIIFNMDTDILKSVSERYNSTITEYLLSLIFIACKKASNKSKGDISIQVPINLRKYYKTKTLKNFSMFCEIRISINEINDILSIINKIHLQLKEKTSRQSMEKMITHIRNFSNIVKYIPLFIKKPLARIGYILYGERVFTNTLSNIGTVKFPPIISEKIENLEGIIYPMNFNRAGCLVITCNNTTTFSINKRTTDIAFEKEMMELLEKDGIKVTIQGQ